MEKENLESVCGPCGIWPRFSAICCIKKPETVTPNSTTSDTTTEKEDTRTLYPATEGCGVEYGAVRETGTLGEGCEPNWQSLADKYSTVP